MKKIMSFMLSLAVLSACSAHDVSEKVKAQDAIRVIQKSASAFPGVNTSDAIAAILKTMQSNGNVIDIVGWTQAYRSGGTHDIWFKVKANDSLSEFHWVISPDGTIKPGNRLTGNVTKKQIAKL